MPTILLVVKEVEGFSLDKRMRFGIQRLKVLSCQPTHFITTQAGGGFVHVLSSLRPHR